jgi:tight adherence protein B
VIAAVLAGVAAWVVMRPTRRLGHASGRPPVAGWSIAVATSAAAIVVGGVSAGAPRQTALALVLLATALATRHLWRAHLRAEDATATRERVLECCDLLAAELAAGQPPSAALVRAAETWPAIAPVAQTVALGGDVPASLRRLAEAPGAEGLALVAAGWQVAHRTGHGLADALGRIAWSLREARSTDRVVRGELASARATARLVAALPVPALAIGAGSGGDPLAFLLGTPLGLACLAGGLTLGLAGLAWIERIAAEVGR